MPLFASYSLLIRFLFASHSSHHQIHSCKISIIFVSVYFITKQIRVSFNTNNNSSSSCLLWPLTSLSFLYIFYYYYFFYEGLLVVDSLAVYMYFVLSAREMSSRRLARQCYYILTLQIYFLALFLSFIIFMLLSFIFSTIFILYCTYLTDE